MTTATTTTWAGELTALTSIVHGGQAMGSITLLRRERILSPDGQVLHVPLVSGNALRGRLRRIGEELLRDVLNYEGQLPLAAAHALRGGGSLAKVSGEPLSGARLRTVRALVPLIAAFGAAAGGRIIDGTLQVGALRPHLAETAHLTGHNGPALFTATQLESYTRRDETTTAGYEAMTTPTLPDGSPDLQALTGLQAPAGAGPMLWRIETFPAGTVFSTWIRLARATPLTTAFVTDVLDAYRDHATVGGRAGIGHGHVRPDWTITAFPAPAPAVDWRAELTACRGEVLHAIHQLT